MLPLLEVKNLRTTFKTQDGLVQAVNGVNFTVKAGECLGIVGESGAGKSQIFMSIMGLLASNGSASGNVLFKGQEILNLPLEKLNDVRGDKIAMIFQDPMTSLNPYLRISQQLTEVLIFHKGMSEKEAQNEALNMLDLVRIPEAKERFHMYPHELSGGMRQRIMIAIAMLCKPDILIADEPTTALDVTIQSQILHLMEDLKSSFNTTILLITHDLGVVASLCDRVIVMYGGQIVEEGDSQNIFYTPQHPYTQGLLKATPRIDQPHSELFTISGHPAHLLQAHEACAFSERCSYKKPICLTENPPLEEKLPSHKWACAIDPFLIQKVKKNA